MTEHTPTACPHCLNTTVAFITDWEARSSDPTDLDNTATVAEYQCLKCAVSFWV